MDKEDFIEEVRSFCDEENIKFSYYHDVDLDCYSIRLEKNSMVIRKKFAITEIEYTPKNILMKMVYALVRDIYDSIRNKMVEE